MEGISIEENLEEDEIFEVGKIIPDDAIKGEHIFWFEEIDIPPIYPGGDEARIKFLQENITYPRTPVKIKAMEVDVLVTFVVEKDGNLTNFSILKSVSPILDDEALRVVKLMPKWMTGQYKRETVRVRYQMPVTFKFE